MSYNRLNEAFNRIRTENGQLKNDLDLHDITVDTYKARIKFLEESLAEKEKAEDFEKIIDTTPKLLKSVAEHPDVQESERIINSCKKKWLDYIARKETKDE
jgi:predicted nuclease with TOPRIM domain